MKCPTCGKANLVHVTMDRSYTYKGQTIIVPSVTGDHCPACDEFLTGGDDTERMMDEMLAFNKKVNASLVDPGFIAKVRKQLNLDQQEAARIFGGGVNAFSRYETGSVQPPVALVKLFKLLERHPDLFEEVLAA
ncbi:type II toxin-antitoxin system MqsA family antitoxin [Bordetella sp. N]|uniref:type II toxin-antitoxin system MqsA family antitoxin n=1 Tax=Bordetella sp. N TaxID=1746199 RepID=UPI00070DD61F|nr:type II toxin-antitoxin system MqsA family antitoxin [Bordetella sp. N]ALM82211.1 antitoxin [Bordetella sp. N]